MFTHPYGLLSQDIHPDIHEHRVAQVLISALLTQTFSCINEIHTDKHDRDFEYLKRTSNYRGHQLL